MQDPPELDQLVSDAREVARSIQQLETRSRHVVQVGHREPPSLWSGQPRCAAACREVAAESRRCAALAASVGLRLPGAEGTTWLEAAATCQETADGWEQLAGSTTGWGWRQRWLPGALLGSLAGSLLAAAAVLLIHLASAG